MPNDHPKITVAGKDINLDSLNKLSKDEKVELMREWFLGNYEDPVERTPYVSAEGGYFYIYGGPYEAYEELSSEFEGYVNDDLIVSLADELSRCCDVWTRTERPDDYEYHHLDLFISGGEFFQTFKDTLSHIEEILSVKCGETTKRHLFGLLYINVITAIETYLSDAFINAVIEYPNAKKKFVETNPAFEEIRLVYSDIYKEYEMIDKKVKEHLIGLTWHNLGKIEKMYASSLDINFADNVGKISKAINNRHHLVHRSGRDKDGEFIVISENDLKQLMIDASLFVERINGQFLEKYDKKEEN